MTSVDERIPGSTIASQAYATTQQADEGWIIKFRNVLDHPEEGRTFRSAGGQQLQGARKTTTLAHYLELLSGAGMLTGFSKFAGQTVRHRGSNPKLQVLNTALMTARSGFVA